MVCVCGLCKLLNNYNTRSSITNEYRVIVHDTISVNYYATNLVIRVEINRVNIYTHTLRIYDNINARVRFAMIRFTDDKGTITQRELPS